MEAKNGEISDLKVLANLFCDEPKDYVSILKTELSDGNSYASSRENAVVAYLKNAKYSNILSSPNNILGIEYLKALRKTNSSIIPYTIKRHLSDYSSTEINSSFASSTAIRNLIVQNNLNKIKEVMPEVSYDILLQNIKNNTHVLGLSAFEKIILYKLRTMSLTQISNLPDVSEGLENTLKKAADENNNLFSFIELCKSKRFTYSRLQRILLYALLDITKEDMELSKTISPYIRVLGMNANGKKILSDISKNSKANVITSLRDFEKQNKDLNQQRMLDIDKKATDVYTLGFSNNISYSNLDYTKKIIIR